MPRMDAAPTPDELRALIAPLDARDRKVLGALAALMMSEPDRVRDREWLDQHFVEVAVFAHGFDGEEDGGPGAASAPDAVEQVRAYAAARSLPVLNAAVALFVRTAAELQAASAPPSMEAAQAIVRGYLDS